MRVRRGGDFDRWDLDVRPGLLGGARVVTVTEEHGDGRQLSRFRVSPRCSVIGGVVVALTGALTLAASVQGTAAAAVVLGVAGAAFAWRLVYECAMATGALGEAIDTVGRADGWTRKGVLASVDREQPAA
jgi:hypothetical protein